MVFLQKKLVLSISVQIDWDLHLQIFRQFFKTCLDDLYTVSMIQWADIRL